MTNILKYLVNLTPEQRKKFQKCSSDEKFFHVKEIISHGKALLIQWEPLHKKMTMSAPLLQLSYGIAG